MSGDAEPGDGQLETERWFISRGMPHFIEDYSASRDVFTRTLPVLTLVFLFEFGGAFKADWTWWENVLAAFGGFGLLLGVWVLVNLARRNSPLSRPARVGPVELGVFVLAPALVPLVFGGQLLQAAGIAAANLALLGAIYLVTSYALIPLTRWAVSRVFRELGAVVGLLARALPLLLLFTAFLFINTEAWQVTSALEPPFLIATVTLFVLLGGAFLLTHLPRELDQVARFTSVAQVRDLCRDTPAAGAANRLTDADLDPVPLNARQRGNAALVVVVSEAIQITLVAVLIASFFVLFGLVSIRPSVIQSWVGASTVIWDVTLVGLRVVLTEQLLRVSAFLGAFSGFYFTVYVITDVTYRQQFFDEVVTEMRQVFAVRTAYLSDRR